MSPSLWGTGHRYRPFDGQILETGNEQMAQTLDACLEALGEGPELPELQHWDDFIPEGYL